MTQSSGNLSNSYRVLHNNVLYEFSPASRLPNVYIKMACCNYFICNKDVNIQDAFVTNVTLFKCYI